MKNYKVICDYYSNGTRKLVCQTNNPSIFGLVKYNRSVEESRAKAIAESMRDKFASIPAIICNQHLDIIDGQHRRRALEILIEMFGIQLDFEFIIVYSAGIEEVSLLNTNGKSHTSLDTTIRNAKQYPSSDYGYLIDLMVNKYPWFKTQAMQAICKDPTRPDFSPSLMFDEVRDFKKGNFIMLVDKNQLEETLPLIDELLSISSKTYYLIIALYKVINQDGYDHKRMIKYFKKNARDIKKKRMSYQDYVVLLSQY